MFGEGPSLKTSSQIAGEVAAYFLDSSGAAKLYVVEPGSGWMEELVDPSVMNECFVASIAAVEVTAAMYRRVRAGSLSRAEADAATEELERDLGRVLAIVELSQLILIRARDAARQHGLRGYDCVQLASALFLQEQRLAHGLDGIIVVSADKELNSAATREGVSVEDPNMHR